MINELTNNLRKLTASLGEAKHRKASGLFKAEGTKCVLDTISHFRCPYLIATDKWLALHGSAVTAESVVKASARDMERMSSLSTAPDVIAVYEIPVHTPDFSAFASQLCLALDCIQDPGNLGTIIRTADWFGVRNIICSPTTADVYNPKVVQATMGAISRVDLHYCDLAETLSRLKTDSKVRLFGTFLGGDIIYHTQLPVNGIIVMGNEGKGISPEIADLIDNRLYIPSYPPGQPTSESLNVAIATAVTLSEFLRNKFL